MQIFYYNVYTKKQGKRFSLRVIWLSKTHLHENLSVALLVRFWHCGIRNSH